MKLKIDERYLIVPVSEHAQVKKLYFKDEAGGLLFDLDVRLNPDAPRHLYYADMQRFAGRSIELRCEPAVDIEWALTNSIPPAEENEFRPIVHFTPLRGWINDPNGLVYYEGKYHLFYQHNPVGMHWGNMHWGHAVSDDLIDWQEKEIALYPDEFGTMFSGCAVIDERNATGLQTGEHAPLLLYYTAAGNSSLLSEGKPFVQCLAYSIDGGETFIKYEANPILGHIAGNNRDPKVVFCPEIDAYIMALYLENAEFALLRSCNLLQWEMIQRIDIPSDGECPDFFPLMLDDERYWILSGASDYYIIGRMTDGHFSPVQDAKRLKSSKNTCYAAQTYSGLHDERRIRLYWNRYNLPAAPFNCSMSTPLDLFLTHAADGSIALGCRPVKELQTLHENKTAGRGRLLLSSRANDIRLIIPENTGKARISFFGLDIDLDATQGILRTGDDEAKICASDGRFLLRIIQDVHSTEIYTEDGLCFLCTGHLSDSSLNHVVAPEHILIEATELRNYRLD